MLYIITFISLLVLEFEINLISSFNGTWLLVVLISYTMQTIGSSVSNLVLLDLVLLVAFNIHGCEFNFQCHEILVAFIQQGGHV